MGDHDEESTHVDPRSIMIQQEENVYFTNNQGRPPYNSRFLSHGIEQIVDNLPRHSHTTAQSSHNSSSSNTIYQPHNLKDSSNDISFDFHSDSAKMSTLPTTTFSFMNNITVDRVNYPRENHIQGSGSIESLLNLTNNYSTSSLNPTKDFTAMKNVKFQSLDGNAGSNNTGFHDKDTGLAMLSILAHNRSPISEHAEGKKNESILNSTEEVRNAVQFSSVPDSNNTQFTISEIIIKDTHNHNVRNPNRNVQENNSTQFTVDELIIKNTPNHSALGPDRNVFDDQNAEFRGFDDGPDSETITISLDTVPYTSTTKDNMLYNPIETLHIESNLSATNRDLILCEEDKQVYKYLYNCGGCDLVFGTLCNLHIHLESHGTDGSYVFDRSTRTAYPKFGVASVGTQTLTEGLDKDLVLDSARGDLENLNPSYLQDHPFTDVTITADATIVGEVNYNDTRIKMEEFDVDCGQRFEEKNDIGHLCDGVVKSEAVNTNEEKCDSSDNNTDEVKNHSDDDDDDDDYSPAPMKDFTRLSKRQACKQALGNKKELKKGIQSNDVVKKVNKRQKKDFSKADNSNKGNEKGFKKSSQPKETLCTVCGLKFKSREAVQTHLKVVHGIQKLYHCRTCSTKLNTWTELKEHINQKHKNQVHKCDICDKVVSTAASLRDHINYHMGVKPHACSMCDNKFRTTGQLNAHIHEKHESSYSQQCEYCGKTFTSRYRMREHTKQCLDIKPHKCDDCGKRFIRTTQLRVHQRTHTGEKPYVCDVCGCALTNYSSLIKHKRIHTGEKPYKCDQCPQAFSAKTTLIDHQRIHTQDKRFQCTYCGRSFIKKWNLKTHLRQHTGETPYTCKICGQGFKQNVLLKTHIQSHNNSTSVSTTPLSDPKNLNCQLMLSENTVEVVTSINYEAVRLNM